MDNPFELVTASKLTAKDAISLWCDDSRLDRVRGGESCFINGNRGTGKSMLFRILQSDCQELLHPKVRRDFLSIYFAVRDSDLMVEELELMQTHRQKSALSESHLSLLVVRQLFVALAKTPGVVPADSRDRLMEVAESCLRTAFDFSKVDVPPINGDSFEVVIRRIMGVLNVETARLVSHIQRQIYGPEEAYEGPLFFFDSLLAPLADFFLEEVGVCLFVLVDDGDDLPESHTVVLNSWIARRRSSVVFKVSTMYAYKTYTTRSGSRIQQPHDFIEYDIATRFLEDDSGDYVGLVRQICIKRLKQAGVCDDAGEVVAPEVFFPQDAQQEERLAETRARLTKEYGERYSGRAVRDNVYRHLTSEYMKELNQRRALASYRYAGFRTLAVLSGGLVRDFIICAQRMYDDASRGGPRPIKVIPPSIQNEVVRKRADTVLLEIEDARQKRAGSEEDWCAVGRLVAGLGATFKKKMLSDDSERRVFSFAFQSRPKESLLRLLSLAVGEGYLVRGFISKKEGIGRRYLYVLTRRVAPAFSLDVSAYSGYLSVEPHVVERLSVADDIADLYVGDPMQEELFATGVGQDWDWVIAEPDGRETW